MSFVPSMCVNLFDIFLPVLTDCVIASYIYMMILLGFHCSAW